MMNKVSRHATIILLALVAIIAIDRCSSNATALSDMDSTAYQIIKSRYTWYTDTDIAHEYNTNREYWDEVVYEFEQGNEPTID